MAGGHGHLQVRYKFPDTRCSLGAAHQTAREGGRAGAVGAGVKVKGREGKL